MPPLPALANTFAARACNYPRARTRSPLRSAPTWTHPRIRATRMHWSTTMGARTYDKLRKPSAHPHDACPHSPHWQTHARHVPATIRALGSTPSCFPHRPTHPLQSAQPRVRPQANIVHYYGNAARSCAPKQTHTMRFSSRGAVFSPGAMRRRRDDGLLGSSLELYASHRGGFEC